MATRSRKETKKYLKILRARPKSTDCNLCNLDPSVDKILQETKSFKVINNLFAYSYWDRHDVDDHIMIIPKKHTETISSFTASESSEWTMLLGSYELQGYNIYSRAPGNDIKTVAHQHTHLIKPGKKTPNTILFINKPYFRFLK